MGPGILACRRTPDSGPPKGASQAPWRLPALHPSLGKRKKGKDGRRTSLNNRQAERWLMIPPSSPLPRVRPGHPIGESSGGGAFGRLNRLRLVLAFFGARAAAHRAAEAVHLGHEPGRRNGADVLHRPGTDRAGAGGRASAQSTSFSWTDPTTISLRQSMGHLLVPDWGENIENRPGPRLALPSVQKPCGICDFRGWRILPQAAVAACRARRAAAPIRRAKRVPARPAARPGRPAPAA